MPTYTYSGDPNAAPKDSVRFLLSDTGPDSWLLSDQEIAWMLTQNSNPYLAAALGADQIAASYAKQQDKTIGPLTIRNAEKGDNWSQLAKRLRDMASQYSGGILAVMTQSSKEHLFVIGQTDYPGANWPFDPDFPPLASQT